MKFGVHYRRKVRLLTIETFRRPTANSPVVLVPEKIFHYRFVRTEFENISLAHG